MAVPKISVIMLTYNRENLVGRAVESILNQTMKDFEFIVVDNGSTDRSGSIVDEYAAKDSRIQVIHRERGNIGSGRNAGLAVAFGDYIVFIDDDDYAEPDFLEFLYVLAKENEADVAICGSAGRAFDEKRVMTPIEALMELMWRKRYTMAFPTKLFRLELRNEISFPESDKYDDISQMHVLLARSRRVAYHGLPKYTFYRHENNNSAWTTNHNLLNRETLEEYLSTYRVRTQWLCEEFPRSALAWHYFEWSFMLSMVEKIKRLHLSDCEDIASHLIKTLMQNRQTFLNCEYIQDFEKEWISIYIEKSTQNK